MGKEAGLPPAAEDKQDAYALLRKDIIGLFLKPGTIVSIRELCGHYGISRSPTRDALIRLGEEGLIVLLPQRGIMISKIDIGRVEEERFLRVSVERNVMELYLAHHDPSDPAYLEEAVRRQSEAALAGDYRRDIALDDEFHRFFYRATGRTFCADVIAKSSGHYLRVRLLTCVDRGITQEIIRQHREMVEAVKAGDGARALGIFDRHLSKIGREERTLCEKYPALFLQSAAGREEADPLKSDFLQTLKE